MLRVQDRLRLISTTAFCLLLLACSSSDNDNTAMDNEVGSFKQEFDPSAQLLEHPPTDGKLPTNLRPPV